MLGRRLGKLELEGSKLGWLVGNDDDDGITDECNVGQPDTLGDTEG